MAIILFNIDHYNPDTAAVETLRISTAPYISAITDTPAATIYDDRVVDGGNIERHIFGAGRTYGQGEMAAGELVLSNLSGSLDYLRTHGFDFRKMTVFRVENDKATLASATQIATLYMEKAEFSWSQLRIVLRDPMLELDVPVMKATFAGTNSGATGYEGLPNDIKGKLKPHSDGIAEVVSPTLVNSSSLIFIASWDIGGTPESCQTIDDVRLDGNAAAVTIDATVGTAGDTTTLALLGSASIAAGKYATCKAASAIRFNSLTTNNVVTCRITRGAATADRTPAQLVKKVLTERAGIDAARITGVTALDALQANDFGYYVDDDITARELCWKILEGAGGYLVGDALGRFEMGRLEDPTGGSVVRVFEEWEISNQSGGGIEMIPSSDNDNGLPTWKTFTLARKNWRTFTESDFAGAVSIADREILLNEWRSVVDSDSAILTKNLGAANLIFESYINSLTHAATENTRQLTMRKTDRGHWKIRVKDSNLLQLGQIVQINTQRFGFAGSKKFVIMGYQFNFFTDFVNYYLWG